MRLKMKAVAQNQRNKDLYFNRKECPGCSTTVSKATPKIHSCPQAECITPQEHGQFLSGYTNNRFFFSYYRCENCSLLYCPTYYNDNQLGSLYKNQPENMAEIPLNCRVKTQYNYFKKLKKYSSLKGGYLEIGADIGIFTSFCVQEGNFDSFYLFEPNVETHGLLKKATGKHPSKIITENFQSSHILPQKISTAVIIHTLDHVLEPRTLLREMSQCLEKDGVLLLVTHDESSFLARLLKKRWPPYTLQHPQLFSPKTMTGILQEEGFQVLEVSKSANVFPLFYLIKSFFVVFGLNKVKLPEFASLTLPIKLGNILTIARKM